MGRTTRVPIRHQRALNQTMLYTKHAPPQAFHDPILFLRALRSALRMSQAQLARRVGVPQAHIARLEAGALDPRLSTLRRLFDTMFCDLLVLPRPRKRPSDVLADRYLGRPDYKQTWDD
ncbi:MAG: helix-turn-helix domain-containing protein [Elusimicrobiota bacterium]